MKPTKSTSSSSGNVFERLQILEENFLSFLINYKFSPNEEISYFGAHESYLEPHKAVELFKSQAISRVLDLRARLLKEEGEGFYTIASAGHEGNVVLGDLLSLDDYCLLHYRSGAFVVQRALKAPQVDVEEDLLLSFVASRNDPTASGRHKVFGSKLLNILPQTSTIASHIPKSMGLAYALEIKKRKYTVEAPDAIVCCSFGDASCNHSTLLGGVNAAQWIPYINLPLPILFVCEDNGMGISVKTPEYWVEQNFSSRIGLTYFKANGLNLANTYQTAKKAIEFCRLTRRPVFLHITTVRLGGHAGSDIEKNYRSLKKIEETETQDPLLASAKFILDNKWMKAEEMLQWYSLTKERIETKAKKAKETPKLSSVQEITEPLQFPSNAVLHAEISKTDWLKQRQSLYKTVPEKRPPDTLSRLINMALLDCLQKYPKSFIFGQDVGRKGGVYTVTKDLIKKMGSYRVFNTLLDEQSIFGVAQGLGMLGLLPIPEIQYLAYIHNALDQLRGEACSLAFFSNKKFLNPMVVRVASMAYQKGFGGHFHNDNSITALRDIPGLLIAMPSRGDDAVKVFRTLIAAALTRGTVSCFLEPIALYFTRDLHEKNDKLWLSSYPAPSEYKAIGEGRSYSPKKEANLTIITYGNGTLLSLKAAKLLEEKEIYAKVIDLIWLNPLNENWIREKARETGKVVIVDEGRKTGGISEAIITALYETRVPLQRVVGEDTYIPLGAAANYVLPSVESIYDASLKLF